MSSCNQNVTAFLPAPEGYDVDFCNPQRRAQHACYWCFGWGAALSILFTAQRLYVKLGIGTGWHFDDTILAFSWFASFGTQLLTLYGFANGYIGIHVYETSVENFNTYLLILYISAPLYIFAGSCAKIALCIFYLRLSPQQWFRYSVFATITFIVGYSVGIFFSLVFACTPVQKSFDTSVVGGTCIATAALYIATAVFNIVSDVILFVLPIPMVVGLQMKRKQKLGLLFIFGIGSATVVTSIIRAVVLPALLTSTDSSWDVSDASVLIVVEANLIIICGMLPTLRKFCRHVAPKLVGESYGSRGSGKSGSRRLTNTPAVMTFGSAPSSGRGHRGYAQFDDVDEYSIALKLIGGRPYEDGEVDEATAATKNISAGVPGIFRHGSRKGRVDTIVMAGTDGMANDMAGGGAGEGSQREGVSRRDSQLASMRVGGTAASSSNRIKATTRIEVSYDSASTLR